MVILTDCILLRVRFNKDNSKNCFMSILDYLKKKITKFKNRFDVQKVPVMLRKDIEAMAYLNKI
tara:strand:+ start:2113 stop:2304 length:192 start_codon:yes stop_codon:yes gene_type:complete